jgi:hypothetical protein
MAANDPPAAPSGDLVTWRAFINRPLLALALIALAALSLAYQRGLAANLSSPGIVLSGFYDLEGGGTATPYRWTDGDARVWLGGAGKRPWHVTLNLGSARPNDVELPALSVLAGDTLVGSFKAPRPVREFSFDIPAEAVALSGDLDLHIRSDTFAPANDLRTLGVALYGLRVEAAVNQAPLTWPAPVPLAMGTLAVSLLFLALSVRLPIRLAWLAGLAVVVLLAAGLALERMLTVAVLPWLVLLSVIAYVASSNLRRES